MGQGERAVIDNHPQPGIWEYENEKNQPSRALVLELQNENWQAAAAACITPAFIDRRGSIPILFDDGSDSRNIKIPHDVKTLASFGSDASSATANIAQTYWTKAEIVVITDTYEHVLWLVPTASFLSAPILINPSSATLTALGSKCAVILGAFEPDLEEVISLTTKEDVWTFQLELLETKGQECNYIILTNPWDTEDQLDTNIKWPYLSLVSAPLAAYRKAVVQTGDWTAPKSRIEQLELGLEKDGVLYNDVRPYFDDVKKDSYAAEKYLLDYGHTPEYLAVVGGPYAVPNYFYDILVNYRYPTGNPQKTVYPSSIGAYAVLQQTVSDIQYTQEDLASGRILASSICDASGQLAKTLFYREFLPGGIYHSATPFNWHNKACVVDGHRLNQPEPNNLIWDPQVPYHPAGPVLEVFENGSFVTTYYLPRNGSDPYDTNPTIMEIMKNATHTSLLQLLPHGGSSSLRIEIGIEPITGEGKSVFLEANDLKGLNFSAPTIIYTGCCKGANPFMLDDGFEPSDFVTSAFIHAGCVAYIATPEIQSTCFWREAPYGVSTQQTIFTWEKLLASNMPIGMALRDAKWEARQWAMDAWPKEPSINLTFEVDCFSYQLFGDPALEPYKPDVAFEAKEEFDVDVRFSQPEAGKQLDVQVALSSLKSGESIDTAEIKISFNGRMISGSSASFELPDKNGAFELEVSVEKSGYRNITARYVLPLEGEGADDYGLMWLMTPVIIIAVVAAFLVIKQRKKK